MEDDLQARRRAVEAALAAELERAGVACEDLAELVCDCAVDERAWAEYLGLEPADDVEVAAEVNGCDLAAQIRYVLSRCGLAEGEARLREIMHRRAEEPLRRRAG
jgi:hypothetical protein